LGAALASLASAAGQSAGPNTGKRALGRELARLPHTVPGASSAGLLELSGCLNCRAAVCRQHKSSVVRQSSTTEAQTEARQSRKTVPGEQATLGRLSATQTRVLMYSARLDTQSQSGQLGFSLASSSPAARQQLAASATIGRHLSPIVLPR